MNFFLKIVKNVRKAGKKQQIHKYTKHNKIQFVYYILEI